MAEKRGGGRRKGGDGLEEDFGPGFEASPGAAGRAPGPETDEGGRDAGSPHGRGIPCGRDGCFLKPFGDLATRFALELARRGHADSAARATISGIEFLKALRDFLDEEIAFAERVAERQRSSARYTKIPVE